MRKQGSAYPRVKKEKKLLYRSFALSSRYGVRNSLLFYRKSSCETIPLRSASASLGKRSLLPFLLPLIPPGPLLLLLLPLARGATRGRPPPRWLEALGLTSSSSACKRTQNVAERRRGHRKEIVKEETEDIRNQKHQYMIHRHTDIASFWLLFAFLVSPLVLYSSTSSCLSHQHLSLMQSLGFGIHNYIVLLTKNRFPSIQVGKGKRDHLSKIHARTWICGSAAT